MARVLGRCPAIEDAVVHLDRAVRLEGRIERSLKEAVRRSTAETIGCRYCASLGPPIEDASNRREQIALDLAGKIATRPSDVNGSDFELLREEFDEDEIVELMAWISYIVVGGQTFGAAMGLTPAPRDEATWYQQRIVNE